MESPDQRALTMQPRRSYNIVRTIPPLILNVAALSQSTFIFRVNYRAFRKPHPSKSRINPFRSHRVLEDDLRPGDHIYTWTPGFIFSHHGIYCNENLVIHLTAARVVISGSNPLGPTQCGINGCGSDVQGNGVFKSCLNCFKGRRSLYRYEYGVGTFEFFSKLRGGTCTTVESDEPEEVIYRAKRLANGIFRFEPRTRALFERYNLLSNNCEGFAFYCKTSLVIGDGDNLEGASGQVNSWLMAPLSVLLSLRFLRFIPNRVVAAVLAYGVHLLARHAYDPGVNRDSVTWRDVEELLLD